MAAWHGTWLPVLIVALPAVLVPISLIRTAPQARSTRWAVAMAMMIFAGLFIYESHGVTEFHFAVFVGLAFLLAYQDWTVILVGAITIALHHVALAALQVIGAPVFIYSTSMSPILLTVIHALFVVLEAGVLIPIATEGEREWMRTERLGKVTHALAGSDEEAGSKGITAVLSSLERRLTEAEIRGREALDHVQEVEQMATNQAQRAENAAVAVQRTHMLALRLKNGVSQELDELRQMSVQVSESREAIAEMETHADAQRRGVVDVLAGSKQTSEAVYRTLQTAEAASKRGAAAAASSKAAATNLDVQVERVANSVRELGARTDEIRGILTTIQKVSEQTNMLALNAAIEAARAGVHGAGFAVVADEVRVLAGRTNDAADDVSRVVQDMTSQIESILEEVSGTEFSQGLQASTSQALNTLVSEIEAMRKDLDLIQDASKLSAKCTDANAEVFRSIESLASGVAAAADKGRSKGEALVTALKSFETLVLDHRQVATDTLAEADIMLHSVEEVSALSQQTSANCAEVRLSVTATNVFLSGIRQNVQEAEAA
jgi:methyl-accepting chemotaxis protein